MIDRIEDAIEYLMLISDYLDARSDVVDGDEGRPVPNEEMILTHQLGAILYALEMGKRQRSALRVISTWAGVDGALVADDVITICDEALKP